MTKLKKALLLTLIFILSLSTFAFATSEIEPRTTEGQENTVSDTDVMPINVTEEEAVTPEIVEHDVYLFDDEIVFDDLVDGNAFLFGSKVTVTGEVNGDLAIFADEVIIEENSYIYSSLYIFANRVTLNGVCYDLYAFTPTFSMGSSSFVYRDLNLISNDVILNGYVNRNANIRTESLQLNYANGPTILGDLNYTSPQELTFEEESVYGTIRFTQEIEEAAEPESILSILQDKIYEVIFLFVVFLLVSWLAPKFLTRSGEYAFSLNLLHALWIGIVASIVLVVGEFILLFFLPKLAIILALITIAAMLLTAPVFAIALTSAIAQKAKVQNYGLKILINLAVAIVMMALPLIPFIGWVFGLAYYILGFGIMILYLFDSERRKGTKKVEATKTKAKKETAKVEKETKSEAKTETKAENKPEAKEDKKDE